MSNEPIALITGGNRGLGRAAAIALAEAGTDVIVTYRSNEEEGAATAEAVTALGRKAVALHLDATAFESFPAFADTVQEALRTHWGRESFDFLVNNAGVAAGSPLGDTTMEVVDLLVDVHFKAVIFLTQALLPLLADGGRIVNLSTSLTRTVAEGSSVYASLKSAVETYSRYLAKELGGRRISVNTVAPGPVGTDLGGGALRDDPQVREVLASQAALGRVGEPSDIGGAIAALLAPGSGWITGQRVEVSGGTSL